MNWRKTFTATALDMGNGVIHIAIERIDGREVQCRWDVFQAIKNELVGEDGYAVEVFPEENRVVNEINRRHLWVLPERLPIGW